MLLLPLQSLAMMKKEPTLNVLGRTTERSTTIYKIMMQYTVLEAV